MSTITGSISPASITSNAGAKAGTITVAFTGVSQDDETNKSTISFSAKGSGSNWLYGYGFYWSTDNSTWHQIKEYTTTSDSSVVKPSSYTQNNWQTGTFTVDHDDNGERTIYFKIKHLFGYGANSSRWSAEDGSGYNAKATVFTENLSTIPLQSIRIKVNGEWKRAFPYVRVNGVWKKATAYIRTNNEWKRGK